MHTRALVLFSGGQDSATCVAWALDRYRKVETVGFDYGQRHAVELDVRPTVLDGLRTRFPRWAGRLGEDHFVTMRELGQLSRTSLTDTAEIRMTDDGLPNTFVPGRNLLFFTYAAAIAYRRNIHVLVGGMCETDYSGYPDCRDDTLKAMQIALSLGMDRRFLIETPLMWLDKAQTWQLAQELGGPELVNLIRTETHTCYLGERATAHDWGVGCGSCPACQLRAAGWTAWKRGALSQPVPTATGAGF
ncbi:MAG: 7-cyano-7-deazaguanine synthase QueC [Burkholderiaceae bacterium]